MLSSRALEAAGTWQGGRAPASEGPGGWQDLQRGCGRGVGRGQGTDPALPPIRHAPQDGLVAGQHCQVKAGQTLSLEGKPQQTKWEVKTEPYAVHGSGAKPVTAFQVPQRAALSAASTRDAGTLVRPAVYCTHTSAHTAEPKIKTNLWRKEHKNYPRK